MSGIAPGTIGCLLKLKAKKKFRLAESAPEGAFFVVR